MTNPLADRISHITPFYVMELLRRAKELEEKGRDVIHMEIGEPDFPTPPQIVETAIDHLRTGRIKYTAAAGLPELREKIAGYYRSHYHVNIDERRIFITPGASGAFLLAFAATLNPDDAILTTDPCYPCNRNFAELFGAHAYPVPVDASTSYQLSAGLIERYWRSSTKGALIASPSNPTGTLIDNAMLKQCIQTVEKLGGQFFSDEIYHGLVYGKHPATALEFSDNVFVINSFSKYFGMTGWRVGWLVVPESFADAAEKLAQNIYISTPTLSQLAALAAFDPPNILELERRRAAFAERRDFLFSELIKLGFGIPVKPEGAFYIYADCSKFTNDSYRFTLELLENEGVAITPGCDFGNNHPGRHVRFAYTTSIERMKEAVRRLQRFIH